MPAVGVWKEEMWMVRISNSLEDWGEWPVAGVEERPGCALVYFSSRTVAQAFARAFQGKLEKADWTPDLRYQQDWQAFALGQSWWIAPERDTAPTPLGRHRLVMREGLVFGSGDHPTTQGCLELLEHIPLANRRVFDLGTGTGILSIAAKTLGALSVSACDTDPESALMAHSGGVPVWHGPSSAARDACCDILLVNIPGYVHLDLAPEYFRLLAPGGRLLLSGYYEWQAEKIERALSGFRKTRQIVRGDAWVSAIFSLA